MKHHITFMKHCIDLGKKAMLQGDAPVGSIIVKDDIVIGIGIEAGKSSQNITRHAEIEAVNDALLKSELNDLSDCTLYTTHEPCLMCSYVIRHYKLRTIVYGTSVDHIGGITSELKVMQTSTVPSWGSPPQVIGDVLKEECTKLTIAFKTMYP